MNDYDNLKEDMTMKKKGGIDKESNPGHRRVGHECEPQDQLHMCTFVTKFTI